jgi:flagellar basal body-associated protein FliL
MSAPSTNVEKQERRHKPVLILLRGLIVVAALMLAGFVAWQVTQADDPAPTGYSAPGVGD